MQAMISGLQPKDIVATVRRQSLESQEKVMIGAVCEIITNKQNVTFGNVEQDI